MRLLTLPFLFLLSNTCYSVDPKITVLRKLLIESNSNEKSAKLFYDRTASFNDKSEPVMIGFKGMSELMLCNHTNNVFSKYNHFNTGKKILETALAKDPENAELIYFRFITQTNAPSFLNYSSNVTKDKARLITYIEQYDKKTNQDEGLFLLIKNYLIQSSLLSVTEKEKIKKL